MKSLQKPTGKKILLLSFRVENLFCFANETQLSMVASKDRSHPEHISEIDRAGAPKALRAAAIYGSNGHGKTRFVDAIDVFKRIVVDEGRETAFRSLSKFKLSLKAEKRPIRFVANFRVGNVDYEYGLVLELDHIVQEWLYETERRQEVMLFERELKNFDDDTAEYDFTFGAKLRKSKSPSKRVDMEEYLHFLALGLGAKETFINEAVDKKVSRLEAAFDWIGYTLQVIKVDSRYQGLHLELSDDGPFIDFLSESLRDCATGVEKLSLEKSTLNFSRLSDSPPDSLKSVAQQMEDLEDNDFFSIGDHDGPSAFIEKQGDSFNFYKLMAEHVCEGELVKFPMSYESSGTRRLLDLLPMIYNASQRESVFVVDELDRKMHPTLAYNLIRAFLEVSVGQLIFTTHTTHLLDLDLLRRDEIWFFEKDNCGNAEVFSLADFSVRPDLDIRKGYLHGRFGALPARSDKVWLKLYGDRSKKAKVNEEKVGAAES